MDLYVIAPATVDDAAMSSASMPEDPTPAWSAATAYTVGQRVHRTTTHKVYEARTDHTGADPADEANVYDPEDNPDGAWITVGATARWKPFDGKISDLVTGTEDLVWNIVPQSMVTAVAVLNVSAASVRVSVAGEPISAGTVIDADTVIGAGGTLVYDEERSLVDNSAVIDWWTYFYADVDYLSEIVVQDVPGYAGAGVIVEIKAPSGNRSVGEIVLGYDRRIGRILTGASSGITDYSRKEFDDFGNPIIVERVYSDTTTYPLILETAEARNVKRILAARRARPSVYHPGSDAAEVYGLVTYGFFRDLPFDLQSGIWTYLNLEVEGLT